MPDRARPFLRTALVALAGSSLAGHAIGEGASRPDASVPAISTIAGVAPADTATELLARLPDGAIARAAVPHVDESIADLRAFWSAHDLGASPLGRLLLGTPGIVQARMALAGLAAGANLESWEAIDALLGGGVAAAIYPRPDADPALALVVRPGDAAKASDLLDALETVAGLRRGDELDPARTVRVGDAIAIPVGDDGAFAVRRADDLVLANDLALLGRVLEHVPDAASVRAATSKAVPADPRALVIADPELIRMVLAQAQTDGRLDDAFAGVLFGGVVNRMLDAERAHAWIEAPARRGAPMRVVASIDTAGTMPEELEGFAPRFGPTRGLRVESLPGFVGDVELSRAMGALFFRRESFLEPQASAQLVEFTTVLTALMGGFDVAEELFDRIDGPMQFVATTHELGERPVRPVPELPALALVVPVDRDAIEAADASGTPFDARMRSAAISIMSVINLEAAQQGGRPLLVELDRHGDVEFVRGRVVDPPGETTGTVQRNFEPAVAVAGDRIVVASNASLLRSILDLAASDGAERAADADHLATRMDGLRRVLAANRESMIAARMLEDGSTRAEAQRLIDAVLDTMTRFDSARLSTRSEGTTTTMAFDLVGAEPDPASESAR